MALAILKTSLKLGTVGGAIYYSIHKGVWSSSSESAEAYEELKTYVVPQVSDAVQRLPYEVRFKWNEGVKSSFSRINSISSITLSDYVDELLKKTGIRSD